MILPLLGRFSAAFLLLPEPWACPHSGSPRTRRAAAARGWSRRSLHCPQKWFSSPPSPRGEHNLIMISEFCPLFQATKAFTFIQSNWNQGTDCLVQIQHLTEIPETLLNSVECGEHPWKELPAHLLQGLHCEFGLYSLFICSRISFLI